MVLNVILVDLKIHYLLEIRLKRRKINIFIYNMDEIIKNTNKPLLLLYLLIEKNTDDECCNIFRIFMTYHSNMFLNYNFFKMKILDDKTKSKELLKLLFTC